MQVTIRKGDTLWRYSQLFNVPLRLVIDSNPNVDPNNLIIGQTVMVPGYLTDHHRIKKGDTLWKMATDRRISLETLLLINPGMDPLDLQVGESIDIPIRIRKPVVTGEKQYDYEALMIDIRRLRKIYPFMRQDQIGNSVMGKALPELQIGAGDKKVHFDGAFHANEWITTAVIMRFVNDYLLALTNRETVRGLYTAPFYNEVMLSIVPMVNPDGVNLVLNDLPDEEPYRSNVLEINKGSNDFSNWKANISGVDLNKQFPARWETEAGRNPHHPAPRDYPGEKPLTEPEALAMAQLMKESDFGLMLAFHTQGEVIYWGFLGLEPPLSQDMVREFARVSGYEPIRDVDNYAGYKDWLIQEWRQPRFTVELGKGENPLPLAQFNKIYQEALGIFLAALYL